MNWKGNTLAAAVDGRFLGGDGTLGALTASLLAAIDLIWDAAPGAAGYILRRSGVNYAVSKTTNFTDTLDPSNCLPAPSRNVRYVVIAHIDERN